MRGTPIYGGRSPLTHSIFHGVAQKNCYYVNNFRQALACRMRRLPRLRGLLLFCNRGIYRAPRRAALVQWTRSMFRAPLVGGARFFASKPRQTPSLATFCRFKPRSKYLQSCLPLVNQHFPRETLTEPKQKIREIRGLICR